MFDAYAERTQCFDMVNPVQAARMTTLSEQIVTEDRDTVLTYEQLLAWLVALAQEKSPRARDALMTLLYTGARGVEIRTMRWEDVDFESSSWVIPREVMKQRHSNLLFLVPQLFEILARRYMAAGRPATGYVFAYTYRGREVGYGKKRYYDVFRRICKKAGVPYGRIGGVTPHDVRRTFVTMGREAGIDLETMGRMMGHSGTKTTKRVYDQSEGRRDKAEGFAKMAEIFAQIQSEVDKVARAG